MPAKYRADHIGSLLRPAELLQARSGGSVVSNCARWKTSTYYRYSAPEGSRIQDIHRWRVAAAQLHERLQRSGGGAGRK